MCTWKMPSGISWLAKVDRSPWHQVKDCLTNVVEWQYARLLSTLCASVILFTGLAASSVGQELGQEYRKGDEVTALRETALKVETRTVGTVPKGAKLVVEQVRGNWLRVRSGQDAGWIKKQYVARTADISASPQQPAAARIHFDRGVNSLKTGEWDKAIEVQHGHTNQCGLH
jgi:hypothetical protein